LKIKQIRATLTAAQSIYHKAGAEKTANAISLLTDALKSMDHYETQTLAELLAKIRERNASQ